MSELYRTQLVYVSKQTFLIDQLLMNFTVILIWISGFIMVFFFKPEKKYRVFGYIFLIVVLLFLITKGKSYYTLGVYTMMFAFGGYFLEKYFVGKLKIVSYLILGFSFMLSFFFYLWVCRYYLKNKWENIVHFFQSTLHLLQCEMKKIIITQYHRIIWICQVGMNWQIGFSGI